jgi:hypothetical protein
MRQEQRDRERALLRLRDVAGLIRQSPRGGRLAGPRTFIALLLALALNTAAAALTLAAVPSAAPAPAAPTCAERFPESGPAGVDLRLGCIVGEVVGLYTAGQTEPPAPLSSYAIGAALAIVAGLALLWLAGRLLARRAGQRLASVVPNEWWVCGTCHSVNGAGKARCYACGAPPTGGPNLTTEDQPGITQSFGAGNKRG